VRMTADQERLFGIDKLNVRRSDIPAVTHVDYSARVQTVGDESQSLFRALLERFHARTGCPVIINTSFNVRGEPIVCRPEEAYRCFMRTQMDYLVMGCYLLEKGEQQPLEHEGDWKEEFELD
jgi:carbamoyltransferase